MISKFKELICVMLIVLVATISAATNTIINEWKRSTAKEERKKRRMISKNSTIHLAPHSSVKRQTAPTITQHSQHTQALISTTLAHFNAEKFNFQWTPRTVWNAAHARHITSINSAVSGEHDGGDGSTSSSGVPYVIIHHIATRQCDSSSHNEGSNSQTCHAILRAIQHAHQSDRGWDDIGYNFLIGGNGHGNAEIYEGRGFNVVGAHTIGYNSRSIGIALIGNYKDTLPTEGMLQKLKDLIDYGVNAGYIQSDYKLLGHRQLSATECPGTGFYNELKNWAHYRKEPIEKR